MTWEGVPDEALAGLARALVTAHARTGRWPPSASAVAAEGLRRGMADLPPRHVEVRTIRPEP